MSGRFVRVIPVEPLTRERIAEIEPNWRRMFEQDPEGNWVARFAVEMIATIHDREVEIANYNAVVACAQSVCQERYAGRNPYRALEQLEEALNRATPDWRSTLMEATKE